MDRTAVAAAFAALEAHRVEIAARRTVEFFAEDQKRFEHFSVRLDDLLYDYSKNRLTKATLGHLFDLARAARLEARREALFSGDKVNNTEDRPALHMALRNFSGEPVLVDGADVMPAVEAERAKVAAFAAAVRGGAIRGARDDNFTDVVNIGIGGSDLGPAMAARALSPFTSPELRAHFVSNVDGADIADTLAALDPARTLFIVSSKTFTTQETMANAASARAWVVASLGEAATADHFAAVSTRLDKVAAFGIRPERVFGFWDWVGGRYSMWSAIGLSLALAIGPERFEDFLRGGHDVDLHFRNTPLSHNIPVLMGLIGVWHRNIWDFPAQAIIPYDQRLARFPAYLQQLDMESNGKSVTRDGAPSPRATGAIVFGEPGTNSQHAFFQLLHQGTEVVPVDFLVAAEPIHADEKHHELLVANCLAQSEALLRGRSEWEARDILRAQGFSAARIDELAPHKTFSGDRPSSTLLYRRLDPRTLGRIVALYEHKVFVQSVIWDINPFDQWGVELGKELCNRLAPLVSDASADLAGLDGSTAGLIATRRALTAS
ncbi:glucose-6-phosphate isomerase [Rhodoblastus acidophilus]|uniref:Glucose-6-phosphate isomerase n=1 Tax=Candidatus Rhodoblastus alkanivorans TaxID=2954117 RepID=A0ABS9Z2W5_9HYPH|nr:glucose-6-phosphate isomerase [Candidatus Rhodoblastus alkanivorans]MCI4679719.1 glucose-6-phosphate isomerase [Candidatus Rhodoblastus alkanivorans]MCI4681957.1 glucose-6-phosphate isomerase [Candidatus Rhodoblastus alkanivorans]MDI4643007.1 glucose-6-phosphate isomerase [Rhodoblastus acidophilus]